MPKPGTANVPPGQRWSALVGGSIIIGSVALVSLLHSTGHGSRPSEVTTPPVFSGTQGKQSDADTSTVNAGPATRPAAPPSADEQRRLEIARLADRHETARQADGDNPLVGAAEPNEIRLEDFRPFALRFSKALGASWDNLKTKMPGALADPRDSSLIYINEFELDDVEVTQSESVFHPLVAIATINWKNGTQAKDVYAAHTTFSVLKVSFAREEGKWVVVFAKRKIERLVNIPAAAGSRFDVAEGEEFDVKRSPLITGALEEANKRE